VFLDALVPGARTTVEQARRLVDELEATRTPYVIWMDVLSRASEEPGEEGIAAVARYLRSHFRRAQRFDNGDEAWVRGPAPTR
jgi:hypothetical protein